MERRLTSVASPHQGAASLGVQSPRSSSGLSSHSDSSSRHVPAAGAAGSMITARAESPLGVANAASWNQDPDVLAWAADTWTQAGRNNSSLIRALKTTVSADTYNSFGKLPIPVQAAMATTWVFACPGRGPRADEFLSAWVARHNSVGSLQQSTPAAVGVPPVERGMLTLQFIVIGVTAAYQFMLVEAAAKMATLGNRAAFTLLPVLWSVADDATEAVVPYLASSGSSLKLAPSCTVAELAQKACASANGWQRDNVRVVVITTLPVGHSQNALLSRSEDGLHTASARHFWFSQNLIGRLMSVLGQGNVVDIQVGPQCLHEKTRSELESLVGCIVPAVSQRTALAEEEKRVVFSNVRVAQAPGAQVRCNDPIGPIDGWMCPEAGREDIIQMSLTGVFQRLPALLATRVFEDRALTGEEQALLNSMVMKHSNSGQLRSVSRQFQHRWLGLEGTPLADSIREAFPCIPWICSATGDAADHGDEGAACGCHRYCNACERLFEATSHLPPLAAVLPSVVAVLDVALQEWAQGRTTSWTQRDLSAAPHNCDASCPKNPEVGR